MTTPGLLPSGVLRALLVAGMLITLADAGESGSDKAPEFPSQDPKRWIGPPQTLKNLVGRVVILDVWTFG